MAQLRVFSLIGDSNIRNHVNRNSCRANPLLKDCQTLSCGNLGIFATTLSQVRAESNVCIVSCVTNFITGAGAEGQTTISLRVEPVLQDIRLALVEACGSNPARSYLISPPMYRSRPIWYREGLPEILSLFSQVLRQDVPPNMKLLPSFATPDFEADGVHLTAYSGLEFILHLFDSAVDRLDSVDLPLPERSAIGQESTRVLEDRVMALEQDHRRLNRVVERKTAVDAEVADYQFNERQEDYFVIEGLERIPSDLVGKAWQTQALKDVQEAIKLLMGKEMRIVFVKNSTGRHQGAPVTYNVQMPSVADSQAIRTRFGSYFLTGRDERPTNIKYFYVKNLLTPETKIRISVLKLIAQRYRDSNPGSKVKVIGYQSRPLLKITPPASASDHRVQSYNYVEAVKTLPCSFSASELEPIVRRINPKLLGQIRSIFVILTDDMYKKRAPPAAARAATDGPSSTEPPGGPEPVATTETSSRASRASSQSSRSSQSARGSKREAESSPETDAPAKR